MQFRLSFIANREDVILGHFRLFRWWGQQFAIQNKRQCEKKEFGDAAVLYGIEALNKWNSERAQFKTFAKAYVYRSLRREFFAQLRNNTLGRDESENEINQIATPADSTPAARNEIDSPELRTLHPNTRRCAELCLAGYDKRQIAVQLGIPCKEVIFHIRQAGRLVLKRRMELSGPSLFDACNHALGTEDVETDVTTCG
jgi:hypothetical protein